MSNYTRDIILALLDEVQHRKNIFRKRMVQLKKNDDISEAILMCCGAISISNLFVSVATVNPITLIIGSTFATINTVGSAVKRVIDIKAKFESCKTTVNQLSDLERETRAVLAGNHLEKKDLEDILDDMNIRISMIEDSSLPLEIPIISFSRNITIQIMSSKLIESKKFGIIDIVSTLMETVESFVNTTGEQKKQYVIEQMKVLLDETEYERYEVVIVDLIEFIIAVSRNKYDLKLNKMTKCCVVL